MSLKSRLVSFSPLWLMVLVFAVIPTSVAQDSNIPDPVDLATRLLGFTGEQSIPLPSPVYAAGDTEDFWVSKADHDTPVQVSATLAGIGQDIYIWVENGITYNPDTMQQLADLLAQLWAIYRIRDNYPQVTVIPQTFDDLKLMSLYQLPDVDNDPHLYILYTSDLIGNLPAFYNPVNSLTPELVPGAYTNQHEMIYVNTSSLPGTELTDAAFVSVLARAFYTMLTDYNNPGQATWLADAFSWYMLLNSNGNAISADNVKSFFDVPETPLTQSSVPGFGAQQLFLNYVNQRFGNNTLVTLATGTGSGLTALDDALRMNQFTDPVTGSQVTGRDVFADFVLANAINGFFGDGRYIHALSAAQGLSARTVGARDQFNFDVPDQTISQLGTHNILLQATQPADFTLFFNGQAMTPRLPMSGDLTNRFYWSGDTPDRDVTLTRTFDLTSVNHVTLTFDAWYILSEAQNYAYVEVSADGGITWDILPATSTSSANPYGLNYGEGFTGISSTEKIRPFPYVGVVLDTDGITVTTITDDGPLAATDLQIGDQIIGHDGQPWPDQPDLISFLSGYEPGDTVNLYIQHGDKTFDLPVKLAASPQRLRIPDALWLPQSVNLSAYAGQSIQVRFEFITLPGTDDSGVAIDNIAVPEINFLDDAESTIPGWTLNGWQQTDNQVRQQFLVQSAKIQANSVHVTQLIAPSESTTQGLWNFSLAANEAIILTISGLNENTSEPAHYNLSARSQSNTGAQPTATS